MFSKSQKRNFARIQARDRRRIRVFVKQYYDVFDLNRMRNLANLYQEGSMLTFQGEKMVGSEAIVQRLLSFQQRVHEISSYDFDFQPSGPAGGRLVFVRGKLKLKLAGEQHKLHFNQMFHLMPTPQGSFYVLNDIFRLDNA